jgi:hypothetical protein
MRGGIGAGAGTRDCGGHALINDPRIEPVMPNVHHRQSVGIGNTVWQIAGCFCLFLKVLLHVTSNNKYKVAIGGGLDALQGRSTMPARQF